MHGSAEFWVLLEAQRGRLLRESLEALTAALDLQRELGVPLVPLWCGSHPGEEQARFLSSLGVQRLLLLELPPDSSPLPGRREGEDPLLRALQNLFRHRSPECLLLGASNSGLALAPRLAALLDLGYAQGITHLRKSSGVLQLTRSAVQARLSEVLRFGPPRRGLISLARRCFPIPRPPPAPARPPGNMQIDPVPLDLVRANPCGAELLSCQSDCTASVDLEDAEVVVAGGRGVGSAAAFSLLEELAGLLGGTVAASRIAVDLGWAGKDRLVGQTGRKISPELYIACGISGAPQHLAGMRESRYILAINTDPLAPIFQAATWAVQADAMQVVPEIIRALKQGTG